MIRMQVYTVFFPHFYSIHFNFVYRITGNVSCIYLGISTSEEHFESFSRGQHRQAMKRSYRYHTAGIVDDIKVCNLFNAKLLFQIFIHI